MTLHVFNAYIHLHLDQHFQSLKNPHMLVNVYMLNVEIAVCTVTHVLMCCQTYNCRSTLKIPRLLFSAKLLLHGLCACAQVCMHAHTGA